MAILELGSAWDPGAGQMSDFERGHQTGECGEGAYGTGNQNYICMHGTFIVVFLPTV